MCFMKEMSNLGADTRGSFIPFCGSLENDHYGIQYETYQVYNAGDPTVVEIFFALFRGTVSKYL